MTFIWEYFWGFCTEGLKPLWSLKILLSQERLCMTLLRMDPWRVKLARSNSVLVPCVFGYGLITEKWAPPQNWYSWLMVRQKCASGYFSRNTNGLYWAICMLSPVLGIITPNSETTGSNKGWLMVIMKHNGLIYSARWLKCCRTLTSSKYFIMLYKWSQFGPG